MERRCLWIPASQLVLLSFILTSTVALADPKPTDFSVALAPDTIDGALWAAECLAVPRAAADCNRRALQDGKPGGILTSLAHFTLLLLDGRILRHSCPQTGLQPERVQARGLLHQDGQAMSVVQLRAQCGASWQVVNLPYSGTEGPGVEVGNE